MYFVVFNKNGRPIYFGPFQTAKEARVFIERDSADHQSFMTIARMISPEHVRQDGGIDVVLEDTNSMSQGRRDELTHKDIIIS